MEYVGTDLKFKASSTGDFSFTEHEWDVEFFIGSKRCTMTKRNSGDSFILTCDQENMGCKPLSDGSWVFLLDTTFFGPGRIIAAVYAMIPDADFDPDQNFPTLDSIRQEVKRASLITLTAV